MRDPLDFCGHLDRNLTALEGLVPVALHVDGDKLRVRGAPEAVDSAHRILTRMRVAADGGAHLTPDDVALAVRDAQAGEAERVPRTLIANARGKDVRPKTAGQRAFVASIAKNTLTRWWMRSSATR